MFAVGNESAAEPRHRSEMAPKQRQPRRPGDDARQHARARRARSTRVVLIERRNHADAPAYFSGELGHCELYANNVYFFMTYGGHRIRCGITDQALEILEPILDQTSKGRLAAFGAHRAIIEHMASTKFDNKMWERDGITILVRDTDIKNIEAT